MKKWVFGMLIALLVGKRRRTVRREEKTTELVIEQAMEESPGELSSKNPMVLSCGGIYIPYSKRRRLEKPLWEIIHVANEKRPSKVVSSGLPKSPLAEILDKERLN